MKTKKLKTVLSLFITVLLAQINYAQTVTIGSQVWMTNNLNVDKFRNGDPIPQAKTDEEWTNANKGKQPAWCYYNNDPAHGIKFGKLYNWYAVVDARGLAPHGWHIPTYQEWFKLINFLGGEEVAGRKMKSISGWKENGHGTNSSGFTGYPGGNRFFWGKWDGMEEAGYWWSATEDKQVPEPGAAMGFYLGYLYQSQNIAYEAFDKGVGLSVRCIKD